jgi:aminotransferase
LQAAGAVALALPESYYQGLAEGYQRRRDRVLKALREAGFRAFTPRGAYYIMCDVSSFGFESDLAFVKYLVEEGGIAAVPGSSFYKSTGGNQQVRFVFAKRESTLDAVDLCFKKLSEKVTRGNNC